MAIFIKKCVCGQNILVNVGNKIHGNTLWWFQSYHCANCGKTLEMDSIDEIPFEYEQLILEQDGVHGLYLNNSKDRSKVEYIIKKTMTDKIKKYELFLEKKTEELIRGTPNEVLLIKKILESKGISSHIIQLH